MKKKELIEIIKEARRDASKIRKEIWFSLGSVNSTQKVEHCRLAWNQIDALIKRFDEIQANA